jgi:hypothetical protein
VIYSSQPPTKRSWYAESSTLESSNYNIVSDSTEVYHVEESQKSADELEELSEDELATLPYPAATPSYHVKKSDYNDLSNLAEESELSADELALDMTLELCHPKSIEVRDWRRLFPKPRAIALAHLVGRIVPRARHSGLCVIAHLVFLGRNCKR